MKTFTVPAHNNDSCQDVLIKCIKFVLPEDLNVVNTINSMCERRRFKLRFIAHYIDYDYDCCNII